MQHIRPILEVSMRSHEFPFALEDFYNLELYLFKKKQITYIYLKYNMYQYIK